MKVLIVGLLSLTLLSTCATTAPTQHVAGPPVPPAGQGFCSSNDGIFVIWINDKGEQNAFVCPKIKGKQITQLAEPPPELKEVVTTPLGEAKKFALEGQPDPCIVWTIGGTRYAFCW